MPNQGIDHRLDTLRQNAARELLDAKCLELATHPA